MNPTVGWALAAAAVAGGAALWGWRGALLGITVAVFGLMLQFTIALRAMRNAANAPVGRVADAQRLASRLKPGLKLVQLVRATGSLGEAISDQPEVWRWSDSHGAALQVTFVHGRVTTWTVVENAAPAAAPAPGP
jgi:hypothetical protein